MIDDSSPLLCSGVRHFFYIIRLCCGCGCGCGMEEAANNLQGEGEGDGTVAPASPPSTSSSLSHHHSQQDGHDDQQHETQQQSSSYKQASEMDPKSSHVDTAAPIDSVKGAVTKLGGIHHWREVLLCNSNLN